MWTTVSLFLILEIFEIFLYAFRSGYDLKGLNYLNGFVHKHASFRKGYDQNRRAEPHVFCSNYELAWHQFSLVCRDRMFAEIKQRPTIDLISDFDGCRPNHRQRLDQSMLWYRQVGHTH